MATTSGNRYRHVVFTATRLRPVLNLGCTSATAPSSTTTMTTTTVANSLAAASDTSTPFRDGDDDDAFIAWVFLEAGLSARHYRPTSLRRRLPACLRALRVDDVSQARRLLRRHPHFVSVAVGALLLGVTEFFRDGPVFASIEQELPQLLLAADVDDRRPLRVWSAGCSDGAELYSVAMLLAEAGALHRCELLGTDCRPEALATAAKGCFGAAVGLRGLPAAMVERYMSPETNVAETSSFPYAKSHQIDARLRQAVRWLQADLLAAPQPGPWDVVLCRNVAMYLQPLAAERLWHGIVSSLRPGGLLVLGKAERPCAAVSAELSNVAPCVYRRRYGAS